MGNTIDTSFLNLEDLKTFRNNDIDNKTGALISQGYIYKGLLFSMSANAQSNLLGVYAAKDFLSYPFEWNTKNDDNTYSILDASDLTHFFMTALETKKAHQQSGTLIKVQIRDAMSIDEVNNIIDNR